MEQNTNPTNNPGKINSILETTMSKIRELVDSETVIGDPIVVSPRLTLIPISKMSFGFASGGSDFPGKDNTKVHFGGGSGGGVTVTPLGFLSVADEVEVTFVPVVGAHVATPVEDLLTGLPEMVGKFKDMFSKKQGDAAEE